MLFRSLRGTTPLVLGRDYLYWFDPTKNVVTFEAATVFAPDSYTLTARSQKAAGGQAGMLTDLANNTLRPNNDDGTLSFAITLQDVPDSPADLTAVFGNTQVTLSWTAPAANGSPIDSYVIEYSTTGIGGWTNFTRPVGEAPTATSTTVTGLTNGQGYWFRVAAHNTLGNGPSSVVGPVTPLKVLTLTLAADTGSNPSDGITNNGRINVGNLDVGATWQYRTAGGAWINGTDTFFTLASGTYAGGSVEVRQSVGGSVTGAGFNAAAITVDLLAPSIAAFTSTTPNGTYKAGDTINITATTSEAVQDGATITVTLDTGAAVTLTRATATTLSGTYTVAAGHNTADLTVTSFTAGTVLDIAGNQLTSTTLPTGTSNIAGSKDIVIDTVAPTIASFTSTTANGTYKAGSAINITATTSEAVQTGATITVTLDTGATVLLTASSQGTTLTGTYTVAAGQNTADLTVTSFTVGTVLDIAGNRWRSQVVVDLRKVEKRPSSMEIAGRPVDWRTQMPLFFCNPVITLTRKKEDAEEGCLSFPKVYGSVRRSLRIRMDYLDLQGKPMALQAGGLLARALQHEVDHLQGILFIDRMEPETRKSIAPALLELMEQAPSKTKAG